jgi:hypothetical protein
MMLIREYWYWGRKGAIGASLTRIDEKVRHDRSGLLWMELFEKRGREEGGLVKDAA